MNGQQPHDAPDEQMLKMLIQRHGDAITQYCRTRLGEGLAEEVVQDVFLVAWQKLSAQPHLVPEGTLIEWVYGVARNKCKQAFRNRTRRQAIHEAFAEEIRHSAHIETPLGPAGEEWHAALRARLDTCLGQLQETDRMVLILWYWKALSVTEIANSLGISVAALRKRLTRAQQRLKELMYEKRTTRRFHQRP